MHKNLKLEINKAIGQLPPACSFMQQCRAFIQLTMHRNFHFLATSPAAVREYELSTKHESLQVNTINHLCDVEYMAPNRISPELLVEQDEYLSDTRRWELASV
jgi:hypothetical protein